MALLRMATGLFFLLEGHYRLIYPHLEAQLHQALTATTGPVSLPVLGQLIRQTLLPNLHQGLNLILDGQILVGVCFVSGLFVPLAAWLAIGICGLLLFAASGNPVSVGFSAVLALICFTLFWGKAGQQFGLDELLRRSFASGNARKAGASRKKALAPAQSGPARKKIHGRQATRTVSNKKLPGKIKPNQVKSNPKPNRPVALPSPKVPKSENIRKLTPPPLLEGGSRKTQSAKVRKLEKVLKRETDKQKRQEGAKSEASADVKRPLKPIPFPEPAPISPVEDKEPKVVKIFDHRTPDDDD